MQTLTRRFLAGATLGLIALWGALSAPPAGAVGRPVDLATMTERAGTIVSGRITQLRMGSHPKYQHIGALYVTVKVDEMMKGTPSDTVTFMQFSGLAPQGVNARGVSMAQTLPDLPSYRVGEEIVLFLYPASNVGFTSPVGGEQGKFLVRRVPGQPTTVVSTAGNRLLAASGSVPSNLTPAQQKLLRQPGDSMDFQTFRAAVKQMAHTKKLILSPKP
jgi:hypothetical protein